ncbi:MAG: hypothetical protein ACLFWL_11760 [Candidatus Brocadiia bacterium]
MSTARKREPDDWVTAAEASAMTGQSLQELTVWAREDCWPSRVHLTARDQASARRYRKEDVLRSLKERTGIIPRQKDISPGKNVETEADNKRLKEAVKRHVIVLRQAMAELRREEQKRDEKMKHLLWAHLIAGAIFLGTIIFLVWQLLHIQGVH